MEVGLQGAHVLVTGANGGIGLETAKLFLAQGSRVTAHYRSSAAALNNFAASASTHTSQATSDASITLNLQTVQADLTSEGDVIRMFNEAEAISWPDGQTHPVDIIIVNHGIWPPNDAPVKDMSLDQWRGTLDNNLTSSFLVCREYLRRLERSQGNVDKAAIILVGSTAGKYGEAGHADYAASKSALMYGFVLSLKNEIVKIAPKGRVNCVAPGWVHTPMAGEALKNPDVVYRALATTPLKKVASPTDVAWQIVVLSSPTLSGHVTGQVVMVEGGMEGRLLNKREDIIRD